MRHQIKALTLVATSFCPGVIFLFHLRRENDIKGSRLQMRAAGFTPENHNQRGGVDVTLEIHLLFPAAFEIVMKDVTPGN